MGRKTIYSPEEALKRRRSQDREYYRNLSPKQREIRRELSNLNKLKHRHEKRSQILALLGNRCVKCGYSDSRALQIDHIHGNGCKEIRKFKNEDYYYSFVLKQLKSGSKDYQCLCANCNWIKRSENGEFGKNPNLALFLKRTND